MRADTTQQIAAGLVEEMKRMPVIDSHEHLDTEETLVARPADVLTRIYSHYALTSLQSAGLPNRAFTLDHTRPLDERWAAARPFVEAIRDTGYARAAQRTAQELFGIEEITDATYQELSARIQANNTPGLFKRVLQDRCRIETVLNQGPWQDGIARSVDRDSVDIQWLNPQQLQELYHRQCARWNVSLSSVEEYLDAWLAYLKGHGCPGIKIQSWPGAGSEPAGARDGQRLFDAMRNAGLDDRECEEYRNYLLHGLLARAGKSNIVVAVHTGIIWECWGDFREKNPLHLVPILRRYRDTTFDLYHGGMPWVREMAVIGNQYPNTVLNLVWCHQISPYMTEHMLNEWIDLVPVTRIIGFGGDCSDGPENALGALRLAQENIGRALAVRIERGQMSESRALDICRMWLYDNPKRVYGI